MHFCGFFQLDDLEILVNEFMKECVIPIVISLKSFVYVNTSVE